METKKNDETLTPPMALVATSTTPSRNLMPSSTSINQYNSSSSSFSQVSSSLLSIKVRLVDLNIIKTLQFNPSTLVFDALKIIREKIPETNTTNGRIFALIFLLFSFLYFQLK